MKWIPFNPDWSEFAEPGPRGHAATETSAPTGNGAHPPTRDATRVIVAERRTHAAVPTSEGSFRLASKIGLADGLIQHLYADLKKKGVEV